MVVFVTILNWTLAMKTVLVELPPSLSMSHVQVTL
ncbi:MAG: hypothetical protein ACI97A_004407 [Planctomycetota bacterium]|jgi:hypothetical protein